MTARPLRILPFAEKDLAHAYHWYESQRPGLGDELMDAIDERLQDIAMSPTRFQVVRKNVRRALVRRFPYCVYFIANGN